MYDLLVDTRRKWVNVNKKAGVKNSAKKQYAFTLERIFTCGIKV